MATAHRNFYKSGIYHVYNRGNHKLPVFHDGSDYQYFLDKLADNCRKHSVTVLAYCLMKNHYHLLVRQETDEAVSRAMLATGVSYVKRFNRKYGLVGRLFQERFQAKLVGSDNYLLHISRYIHLNPVEFTDPSSYPWSSFGQYVSGQPSGFCDPRPMLAIMQDCGIIDYAEFVRDYSTPGVVTESTPGVGRWG